MKVWATDNVLFATEMNRTLTFSPTQGTSPLEIWN